MVCEKVYAYASDEVNKKQEEEAMTTIQTHASPTTCPYITDECVS